MRTGKKTIAVAAAIALTMTGSMALFASETPDYNGMATDNMEEKSVKDKDEVTPELTGTISITDTSVKVPVKAIFDIDPNKALTTGAASPQVTGQATNYIITNLSGVPLNISATKVKAAKGTSTDGADPTFVTTLNALESTEYGIMFSTHSSDTMAAPAPLMPTDKATAPSDDWLKPGADGVIGDSYKFQTSGATHELEETGTVGGKDTLTMALYGATKKGWTPGDTFTVTPTFTVSLYK